MSYVEYNGYCETPLNKVWTIHFFVMTNFSDINCHVVLFPYLRFCEGEVGWRDQFYSQREGREITNKPISETLLRDLEQSSNDGAGGLINCNIMKLVHIW